MSLIARFWRGAGFLILGGVLLSGVSAIGAEDPPLSQQLADAKVKLDEQDAKLAAFQSRYLGSLPDEQGTNLNLLNGMTSQLDAATQALSRAQQEKSFNQTMLNQQLAEWQAAQNGQSGQSPDTLDRQLDALETQLAALRVRYTDDYPDVMKAKADIAALQKKIAQNAQSAEQAEKEKPVVDPKNQKPVIEPGQITQLRALLHNNDAVIADKRSFRFPNDILFGNKWDPLRTCDRHVHSPSHNRRRIVANRQRLKRTEVIAICAVDDEWNKSREGSGV